MISRRFAKQPLLHVFVLTAQPVPVPTYLCIDVEHYDTLYAKRAISPVCLWIWWKAKYGYMDKTPESPSTVLILDASPKLVQVSHAQVHLELKLLKPNLTDTREVYL